MRSMLAAGLIVVLSACSAGLPSDEELRLAAKSELRRQNRPEAQRAAIDGQHVTDVACTGPDGARVCTFKVAGTVFRKTFARTGSGAWSAFDGVAR